MGDDGVDVSVRHLQYAGGQKREFGYVQVSKSDWVLYAAHRDVVGALSVPAARRNGDHGDYGAVRDLVDAGLHRIGRRAYQLRGRASRANSVCLLLDLHAFFAACDVLVANTLYKIESLMMLAFKLSSDVNSCIHGVFC